MRHLHTGAILALAGCVGYLWLRVDEHQRMLGRQHRVLGSVAGCDGELEALRSAQTAFGRRLDGHDDAHVRMALARQMHFDSNTIIGPGRSRDHSLAR